MNNCVEVGNQNYGNVCGGDLSINLVLPCKNGDGILSYEDYQRMPYCNNCIGNSRVANRRRYSEYAICASSLLSVLVIGLYWLLAGHLPSFLGFFFKGLFMESIMAPVFTTGMLLSTIFITGAKIAKELARKFNDQHFPLHR